MRLPSLLVLPVVALLGVAVLTVPAAASGAAGSQDADPSLSYAVDRPVCARPADPAAIRCFAWERVAVPVGTRGSYAYHVAAPDALHGPKGGLTPAALAAAYGYAPSTPRPNFTVAIVDWYDDPAVLRDLNVFDHQYGLPPETSTSFRVVNQNGAPYPLPQPDPGAAVEISLDVQAVRAVCNTCKILLVEANGPTNGNLGTAENTAVRLGAAAVSNSWGGAEEPVAPGIRAAFNHPGVAIVASTGDDGWYGWDFANSFGDHGDSRPSYPASDPNVIAVGGTRLALDASGHRTAETVWNANGPSDVAGSNRGTPLGASGGGCSTLYSAMPWQYHRPNYSVAGCRGKRLSPDVSLDADPASGLDVYDSYTPSIHGWVTVGGTSLSSPLAAAMIVLAGGPAGAAYPSSALYVNSLVHPASRYDVRSGGNSYCGGASTTDCGNAVLSRSLLTHNPNGLGKGVLDCSFPADGTNTTAPAMSDQCNAGYLYDGPSGNGTPNFMQLFRRTQPYASFRCSGGLVGRTTTCTASVGKIEPNVDVTSMHWDMGDGQGATITSYTINHVYHRRGTFLVHLSVVDELWQVVNKYAYVTIR